MNIFTISQVLNLITIAIALPNFSIETKNETRIVGGQIAERNQFKFTVAIYRSTAKGKLFCGGSLISNSIVLTAGHCLDPLRPATVVLGEYDLRKNESEEITFEIKNDSFVIHPDYDLKTITNDIAMLWLPEPIEFTDSIQPIALPKRSQQNETFGGVNATAIGWGRSSDKKPGVAPILQYVELPVIENEVCKKTLRLAKDTNICISGSGGKSTCNGDSGGPLIYKDEDGKERLIGATSFGYYKCEVGMPAAFTRITSYLRWIETNTGIYIED